MKAYSAATYGTWSIGAQSNPVDVLVIANPSSSKIFCRLMRISFSVEATTAYGMNVLLTKNPGIPTGGTSVAVTVAQMNSSDPSPTTTVTLYTAAPSGGGSSAYVRSAFVNVPTTQAAVVNSIVLWDNLGNGEGILIRPGESAGLQISTNTTAGTAMIMDLDFTEE